MSSDSPPPDYYEPDIFRFWCKDCGKETDNGSDLDDVCADCAQPTKRIPDALERVMDIIKRHDKQVEAVFTEMGDSTNNYEGLKQALEDLCDEVEAWVEEGLG
jgi:Zn finger protein HypA/HybF involved in hydrogenase expression